MYRIFIEKIATWCPDIARWCLDLPRHGEEVPLSDLESDGVLFQGWVLPDTGTLPTPYIRLEGKNNYFENNLPRPDVIQKVLGQDPSEHPLLKCGFRFRMPLGAQEAVFGFKIEDRDVDFARLRVEGEMKVLEGLENWLFLGNDTNQSVEQFTGDLLLDRHGRKGWKAYLSGLAKAAVELDFRHAVLIAPAKEMVLPQFYPFEKGETTPVEQMLDLAEAQHRVVYPVEALRSTQERAFRITDTHWSPYGAMLAAKEVAVALGFTTDEVEEVFAQDQYRERDVVGDLGNKLYPRRSSMEKLLVSYNYRKCITYDNFLPNFGRVILVANQDALHKGKCLLFGSSSSYSLLPYLSRIFSELIMVHSAGNIDLDLVRHERPDYVIAQTNGRFVIRPPVVGDSLRGSISEKMKVLSDTERSEVLQKAGEWLAKSDTAQIRFYHRMLEEAV